MSMLYKKNLQLTGACKVGIIETKNNTFYNIYFGNIYISIYIQNSILGLFTSIQKYF